MLITTLIQILAFVAVIMALAWGAMRLEGMDTMSATFEFAGQEATLNTLQLVIAALILVALLWLTFRVISFLYAVFKWLNGDETAIRRYRMRNREKRGYDALSDGMLALASGDGQLALTKADRARRYLDRPELTNILAAQAAEMTGDKKKAEETYKALLTDDRTRFVGVRGLMKQRLDAGDTETAMQLASRAFALQPANTEVSDTLLRLQAEEENWKGARETLGAKLRHGSMPRDVHKRRDAVLALSEAREAVTMGKPDVARTAAIEANRLSPDLVPAAAMAARAHIEKKEPRPATRVIKRAWEVQPHPELAAAFAEIHPEEDAQARIKRFKDLVRSKPDDPESRMLMAELYVAAVDFPEARRALGDLVETDPTARVLTLMAAIERGEGKDDAIVRGWLAKALTAPRGPQWICDNCHNITRNWAPVCPNCKSFDTLSWKRPPESEVAMPRGTEMLPLIVGQIADHSKKEDDSIDAEVVEETVAEPIDTPEAGDSSAR